MKKSKVLLVSVLFIAVVFSCNKQGGNYGTLIQPSGTTSIAIANNGGNIMCDEVAANITCPLEKSSGRIDYNGGNGGTVGPITWTTDGTYVSWASTIPLKIAVIVKGGPNANVFFSGCDNYVTSGTALAAPVGPSGKPYGLSNITFCYTEGKPLAIVLKTYVNTVWAVTIGVGSDVNSLGIGLDNITSYPQTFPIFQWGDPDNQFGTMVVSNLMENNIPYLEVVIKADNDGLFKDSYLYVGSAEGYNNYLKLKNGLYETDFTHFPFKENEVLVVRTFKIPYSEITE